MASSSFGIKFASVAPTIEESPIMRVQTVPKKAELYLQNPENLILVENTEDGVIIRAARDNFSKQRKLLFIRYLAAEGYILDEFQNFGKSARHDSLSIIWAIDRTWVN